MHKLVLSSGEKMTLIGYDLSSSKNFKNIKLIAGESGQYKHISKPYVCTTTNIKPWITGNELLFIPTYLLNLKNKPLMNIVQDSIELKVYGIVVISDSNNLNNFINKLSKNIINKCNKFELPLYIMPYSLKLSEVVDDIYMLIASNYKNIDKKKFALRNLIFNQDKDFVYDNLKSDIDYFNEKYKYGYVGILSSEDEQVLIILSDYLKFYTSDDTQLVYFYIFNKIIFLLTSNSIENLIYYTNKFKTNIELNANFYQKYNFSIGKYITNIYDIQISYKTALKANSFIHKKVLPANHINYNEVNFLINILENSSNNKDLINDSIYLISKLAKYDEKNGSELLKTLYYYLLNDCNIQLTSNNLFVHINTINYRKKIIENLINIDLNNAIAKSKLLISIQVCIYNRIFSIFD